MRTCLAALFVLALAFAAAPLPLESAAAPTGPPGCGACHAPGKARTLDASLKTIKNHPQLPAPAVAVCLACHKPQGRSDPLGPVLHRRHLAAAAFTTKYKGTCTSCHAVDTKTGLVTVTGLPPR